MDTVSIHEPQREREREREREIYSADKSAKKIKPKKEKIRDERLDHPAIQAIRQITNKYPAKESFDFIISELGQSTDIEKYKTAFGKWRAHGYNPLNLAGFIAWVKSGMPEKNGQFIKDKIVVRELKGADGTIEIHYNDGSYETKVQ